jgi:aspartyl-tRNA(Asn)/glutamyl-tRNA(Gln) amidotransferase subunit A
MSDGLQAFLRYGQALSSARLVDGLWRMQAAAVSASRALSDVDLLLMPTAPQRAFPFDDEAPANQADFTALANFHGGPALAVPVPSAGLPVSVQFVGAHFAEPLLLSVGVLVQKTLTDR